MVLWVWGLGFYRGYVGLVEKKVETTIMGYVGILTPPPSF